VTKLAQLKVSLCTHKVGLTLLHCWCATFIPVCTAVALLQVANYCVTKLAELNVPLCTHEVGLTPDTQQPPASGKQYLELTCNGLVSVVFVVMPCHVGNQHMCRPGVHRPASGKQHLELTCSGLVSVTFDVMTSCVSKVTLLWCGRRSSQ
jgi:hypothetical protein